MIEIAYIVLITSTALLMGNEFSIAFFIHPSLRQSDHKAFIPAIQVFARLLGRIMPFWMAGTLAAHLALVLFFGPRSTLQVYSRSTHPAFGFSSVFSVSFSPCQSIIAWQTGILRLFPETGNQKETYGTPTTPSESLLLC